MKVEPSPTSPKVEHSPKGHSERRVMIALAIIAGMVGVVVDIAFHRLAFQFPESGFFKMFVTAQGTTQEVVLVKNEEEQANEAKLQSLQQNVLPRTVAIYESSSVPGSLTPRVLSSEQFRGHALLVTADGLIMATKSVLTSRPNAFVAVTHDRRILAVSNLFEDPASPFVFARIDGTDFSVSEFERLSDVIPGEMVYIVLHHGFSAEAAMVSSRLVTSRVFQARDLESAVHSSDAFDREALLDLVFQSEYEGAGVLNAEGKIVGVVRGDGERTFVVPAEEVTSVFEEAISKQSVSRPSLGIHYLDLSEPIVVEAAKTRNRGAFIFGTSAVPAVRLASPAARAGLREGDIVLKVNGEDLSGTTALNDRLLHSRAGADVTVTFVRGEEEREAVLTLEPLVP